MPPDQLSRPPADEREHLDGLVVQQGTTTAPQESLRRTEDAVLAVLAGTPLSHVADRSQMEAAALAEAVQAYRRAGRQALKDQHLPRWWQLYIDFPSWPNAEPTAVEHLAPLLRQAEAEAWINGWWFIRKHPCWRLRLGRSSHHGLTDLDTALDQLAEDGHIRRWWQGIYEPETTAFGGAVGMTHAHDLFCADSHAILEVLPGSQERLGRRELSVLLCTILFRAAGLEWYEQGDAWHRVAQERPLPVDVPEERIKPMAETLRRLMSADVVHDGPLLGEAGSVQFAATWADAFRRTGQALGASARAGALQRGLRQVLAYHVIFHWNRLGLPLRTQSILATAAHTAILAR